MKDRTIKELEDRISFLEQSGDGQQVPQETVLNELEELRKELDSRLTLNQYFELARNWESPFTKFHKGHFNNAATWAKIFGISEIEFWEHLAAGTFAGWLIPKTNA